MVGEDFLSREAVQAVVQTWQPKIIQAAKKSSNPKVCHIMSKLEEALEGCHDATGNLHDNLLFTLLHFVWL